MIRITRRLAPGALVLALVCGVALPAVAAEGGEEQARAQMDAVLQQILTALRDESTSKQAKRDKVEEIAYAEFDFTTMSKLILARNYKKLSDQQRTDFTNEFKRHMSITYGDTLLEYSDEEVGITGTRGEKNGDVTVRSKIKGAAAEPYLVDYRLRKRGEAWKVIDVVIEGVSLVQNFKTQTQEIISNVGPEKLIEKLREKNAERAKS